MKNKKGVADYFSRRNFMRVFAGLTSFGFGHFVSSSYASAQSLPLENQKMNSNSNERFQRGL